MKIPYRPLAIVREIVNAIGLEVTYAYEDLVYVEHNAFLLQMGASGEIVDLYFNTESIVEERDKIAAQLGQEGQARQLKITRKGLFSMRQKSDGENIEIKFFDET
ncbi:hypothetical protein JCM12296A_08520 [Desulfosarcina cetonica]|uniref:hypothetical protein n=1 Tax=Desulfosarcina cetonica TaxID=90730 RepID=UPI0006D2C062|nr:hypothetical protein [Desulfosarcina cetonica]